MLQTLILNREKRVFTCGEHSHEIRQHCADPTNIIWVDINAPTDHDFQILEQEFGFHRLAIEDCRNGHQRPKVDEYQGYYYLVLYEAFLSEESLELHELNLFLGINYLVTVHSQPIRAVATAERLWREWTDLAQRGTGLPTYLLMDAIVDDYLPILDTLSDRTDVIEDQIFEDFRPESIEEIIRLKKQLLFLRRSVTPLRDVLNTLMRREQPVFSRETLIYFQDVFDHLVRTADAIDTLRELLSATMDAYLSVSSNRMNLVMKRLTAISTILMSATLVAGIYGMNFQAMPELQMKYGYVWALFFMLGVAMVLYFYFRKIRWL
jgi:magnesium transporter